ncbi:MAG TPA: ATP-binding cassette domain-containing protein [Solirubrobacteraceae bacterium]|nr:ATP-binding cassette domain-containing protein [Solirubrobacteraceae bacterium]
MRAGGDGGVSAAARRGARSSQTGPEREELAVDATGLEKSYGGMQVLCGIDLELPRGHVLALLGPNGAGKTTSVRILSTLSQADAGSARVAGFDVVGERAQVRRRISLTGQHAAVDELQTGEENLRMVARLRGLDRGQAAGRAGELLERFDLVDAARRRVGTYSGGMRRRLDLAMSLVTEPDVLFLDEPTTGLDPRSRQAMWQVVAELAQREVSVFLTTQYLEEADRLADHIVMLDRGRIVAQGTAAELKRRVAEQRLVLMLAGPDALADVAWALGDRAIEIDRSELTIVARCGGNARKVRALLDEIDPDRSAINDFAIRDATLDDVFLELTNV